MDMENAILVPTFFFVDFHWRCKFAGCSEIWFCWILYTYCIDLKHFILFEPSGRNSPNPPWGHWRCRGANDQSHLCPPTLPSSCSHTGSLSSQQSAHGPQAMQCFHFIQHINNLKISLSPESCIRCKSCSVTLEGWSVHLNWQEIHSVPDNYNTLL